MIQWVHKIVADLHHACCNPSVAFDNLLKACVRRKQNKKTNKQNQSLNAMKDRPRGNFNNELYRKLHFFNQLTINHTFKSIRSTLDAMESHVRTLVP